MRARVTIVSLLAACGRLGFAPAGDAAKDAEIDRVDAPRFQLDAGQCPPGYVFNAPSCYFYAGENVDITWDAAEAACEADDAHLVIVDDANEAIFIDGLAPTNTDHWIGMSDRITEGTYLVVTGGPAAFLPWETGSPLAGTGTNCVQFTAAREISVTVCSDPNQYLCEYDGRTADPTTY
jgi:hypothetical protein